MATTLVVDLYNDKEQVVEATKFLDKLPSVAGSLRQQIEPLLEAGNFPTILTRFIESARDVFAASDKDAESFICLVSKLISTAGGTQTQSLLSGLLGLITAHNDKPALRLSLLNNVYNINGSAAWRLAVLQHIVVFATETKQFEQLLPVVENFEEKLAEIPNGDKRALLKASIAFAKAASSEQTFKIATLYLKALEGADDLAGEAHFVTQLVIDFVSSPKQFLYDDLITMASVKALATSQAALFGLLEVLAHKDLAGFYHYWEKNSAALEAHGIKHDTIVRKSKMMALLNLANGVDTVVPYKTVASALDIQEDEVEQWVVDAIEDELVEARFDQMTESVHFLYAAHRNFGAAQWKELGAKLATWRETLKGMIHVIQASKQPSTGQ